MKNGVVGSGVVGSGVVGEAGVWWVECIGRKETRQALNQKVRETKANMVF